MRYERIAILADAYKPGQPYMDAYLLDTTEQNPYFQNRPAVVICPGGGYRFVSEREGEAVAMRFLAAGFHAFVLQYSVAPARFPTALTELADAVRQVRAHAADWNVQSDHIYMMGFSAGGHLCASLGTLWNHPVLEEALGWSSGPKTWKPDGMLLCYPVISIGPSMHRGSFDCLLGADPPEDRKRLLSLEDQVTADTVPAFLWHTQEDAAVSVENSLLFAAALRKAGVPFELHIYQKGPHGLSLCDETTSYSPEMVIADDAGWINLAIAWAKRQ